MSGMRFNPRVVLAVVGSVIAVERSGRADRLTIGKIGHMAYGRRM